MTTLKKSARIRQRDLTDCGAACLASLCAYYGLFISVPRLRQLSKTDRRGTSVLGLLEASKKLGFESTAVKADTFALSAITLPAIIQVMVKETMSHFVVLMSRDNEKVTIMDPADGLYKIISFDEFVRLWTGVIVILYPGPDFRTNKRSSARKKMIELAMHHKQALLIAAVCAIMYSMMGLAGSIYLKEVVDKVLETADLHFLNVLSIVMVGLLLLQCAIGLIKSFVVLGTSQAIDRRLMMGYYQHLLHLPQSFFDSMRVGEMVSRINDAIRINVFINEIAVSVVVDVLILFFSLVVMFVYYWKLALLLFMLVPLYLLLFYWNDGINRTWQRRLMESGSDLDAKLVQSLSAATTIKQLGIEQFIFQRIKLKFDKLMHETKRYSSLQIVHHLSIDFITRLFTILIIWIGTYYVFGNHLSKGELLSFYALTAYFTAPVMNLFTAGRQVRDAGIAAERLFEITDLKIEQPTGEPTVCCEPGDIEFKDVSFRYGHSKMILQELTLYIQKGSCVGIMGQSGSGKSTLAALLMKLYDPDKGMILINGVDIAKLNIELLRKMIACVPQQTDLFEGTVWGNIILDDSFPDNERLLDICERLGLTEFIQSLPGGWNTPLNEQGGGLSGGQQQQLSVARAIYRNAPILIMDEPTSSVDEETENKIMQTIEWYKSKGNTVIIITHNVSTLKICDNIVSLKNGRIYECRS